jgi:hypothetical protein
VGFGGGAVRGHHRVCDVLVFHPHLAKDAGHTGRRVEWRGDYGVGKSVQDVELGAVGSVDRRLGCRVASV